MILVIAVLAVLFVAGARVALALGLASAGALIVLAARARSDAPIEVAEAPPGHDPGLLVLTVAPIEEPRAANQVAGAGGGAGVLVIAPAKSSRLDRWATDLDRARFESQRSLTISLASLATAGVGAEGRVGDGDPLQAAEDALRSYAASSVIVVAREGQEQRRLRELERRLEIPLRRIDPGPTEG